MSIVNQIRDSKLSKQGATNPSGVFEGTPSNVGAIVRSGTTPRTISAIPAVQAPVDITYGVGVQPTYLDYLQASIRR